MAQLGGACNGETRNTSGNVLGNQRKLTGNPQYVDEVAVTGWFNGDAANKPLVAVGRFKDQINRDKILTAILGACNNPHIGYDQKEPARSSLRKELSALPGGITPENFAKVSRNCATDCSALVTLCILATCGIDAGVGAYTGTFVRFFADRKTQFESVRITNAMRNYGHGLIPGDICVWRNSTLGRGHIAIVVSDDVSYIPDKTTQGVTGVILNLKNLIGNTKTYSRKDSSSFLQICWKDKNKTVSASKIIVTNDFGIPFSIYGEDTDFNQNIFIGDGRVVQLGTHLIKEDDSKYEYQYAFFPDNRIFADFETSLMKQVSMMVPGTISTLVSNAAKRNCWCAYFWVGINDIFTYKNDFITWNESQQEYTINESFADKFVEKYKYAVNQYINNHRNSKDFKTNKRNKVYIVSLISTSTKYKYYYDMQEKVIDYINLLLNQWAEEEYEQGHYDSQDDCWLQFVWVDDKHNSKNFVQNKDFVDDVYFKRDWFIQKFLPKFNFNDFQGEEDGET